MKRPDNFGKVIFYAPVGDNIQDFKSGGAEAGCKKTIEVLQKAGYKVLLVKKPVRNSKSKFDELLLILKLMKVWIRLIFRFIRHKGSIFHIAGFYRDQVYFEWLLIKTSGLFNIKSIYEIRNGGMTELYRSGKPLYKRFMKSVFINAGLIICQGLDYVKFLKSSFNKDAVYYPNYIMDEFILDNNVARKTDPVIKLIYTGRVVPEKNIEFIIAICIELQKMNLPFTLDIIGGYEKTYYFSLIKKVKNAYLNNEIFFRGKMNFNDVHGYLKKAHFFVFPSKEKREGHSNALTEAMGCGVVPIVSTAGFNESIVANAELVIAEFKPLLYADKIASIWYNKKWELYSDRAYTRIINNYTESVVKESLLSAYHKVTLISHT